MKLLRRTKRKVRIEIIPMIDVIFFLLVYFMLSSMRATQIRALPVNLPKVSSSAQSEKMPIVLSVNKSGEIYINKTQVSLQTLGESLLHAMSGNPQETVLINADRASSYGLVVQAMDAARKIGVRKFALSTEPGEP